jgi:hypothetical protein
VFAFSKNSHFLDQQLSKSVYISIKPATSDECHIVAGDGTTAYDESGTPIRMPSQAETFYDSTAKRLSHREAREDRQENAKSQIIIQDNLRHDSTFLKCS